MNEPMSSPEETKLRTLLRAARPSAELPPRFQENVWRRIERADESATLASRASWLDALAAWILRPQLAFALAAVLVLAGLGLGWNSGERSARSEAQARYLSAVAPNALH
jgi:hypothetical protein